MATAKKTATKATATTKRKKTDYQKFVEGKSKNCAGKLLKSDLNKLEKKYRDGALAKGKSKSDVDKTVKKVLSKPCSAAVSGAKKKATVKGYSGTKRAGSTTYVTYTRKK